MKPDFKVFVNPTGERYGVTASAEVMDKDAALQMVEHYLPLLKEGSTGGFLMVDDSPKVGGQSSDMLLRINFDGTRHGPWA